MALRILGDSLPPARDTLAELEAATWEICEQSTTNKHAVVGAWIVHHWSFGAYCAYHSESDEKGRRDIAIRLHRHIAFHDCPDFGGTVRACMSGDSREDIAAAIDAAERLAWDPHLSGRAEV